MYVLVRVVQFEPFFKELHMEVMSWASDSGGSEGGVVWIRRAERVE